MIRAVSSDAKVSSVSQQYYRLKTSPSRRTWTAWTAQSGFRVGCPVRLV